MIEQKFCKHCSVHHDLTEENWEFTKEHIAFRCKIHRKKQYQDAGKVKAAAYWRALSPEQRAEKAQRKRELRKQKSIDKQKSAE